MLPRGCRFRNRRRRALHRLAADVEASPVGRPLRSDDGISTCCQRCACGHCPRAWAHRALHGLVSDVESLPVGRPLRGNGHINICCQSCACGSRHDHGLVRRRGAVRTVVSVLPTHLAERTLVL